MWIPPFQLWCTERKTLFGLNSWRSSRKRYWYSVPSESSCIDSTVGVGRVAPGGEGPDRGGGGCEEEEEEEDDDGDDEEDGAEGARSSVVGRMRCEVSRCRCASTDVDCVSVTSPIGLSSVAGACIRQWQHVYSLSSGAAASFVSVV